METSKPEVWKSPRRKQLEQRLANYVVFDAMMDAADEGEFTREEAIESLKKEG